LIGDWHLQLIGRFKGQSPGYLGNGADKFSFCHVDDVASGHLAAMEIGKGGGRYLLCGDNASYVEIYDLAASLTHTKPPSFHIPFWVLELAGHISVMWAHFSFSTGISKSLPTLTSKVSFSTPGTQFLQLVTLDLNNWVQSISANSCENLTCVYLSIHACVGKVYLRWSLDIGYSVPVQAVQILKHQWAYSSAKAERELGYKSRPLKEGLSELLAWLKATGRITY